MLLAGIVAATAVVASGCGESDGRGSENRPPLPLVIAAQIGEDEVTASPSSFGAGPISLIASNQTKLPRKLYVEGPQMKRVLPVEAGDTSTVKLTLQQGDYTLSLGRDDQQTTPFTLNVGPKRATTQPRLLLP